MLKWQQTIKKNMLTNNVILKKKKLIKFVKNQHIIYN